MVDMLEGYNKTVSTMTLIDVQLSGKFRKLYSVTVKQPLNK